MWVLGSISTTGAGDNEPHIHEAKAHRIKRETENITSLVGLKNSFSAIDTAQDKISIEATEGFSNFISALSQLVFREKNLTAG